jgi:dipeptidyl aminopeptidase/acylaminoacyl peptidase
VFTLVVAYAVLPWATSLSSPSAAAVAERSQRPVTVADSIDMTLVGDFMFDFFRESPPAVFSPDRTQFVVVIRRGNRATNANDYSLLLFHSVDAFGTPKPETLATLSSPSNNPAISGVRWLADNETVLFLRETLGQHVQIYAINVRTRALTQLTHHPTNVLAFDAAADLGTLGYLASSPPTNFFDEQSGQRGLLISKQYLWDLFIGHSSDNVNVNPPQLFMMRKGQDAARVVLPRDHEIDFWGGIYVSPDGRYAVVQAGPRVGEIPKSSRPYKGLQDSVIYSSDWIVEAATDSIRQLLDAPTDAINVFGTTLLWEANGQSVVVGNTYLPLDTPDPTEASVRQSERFAVEVDVATGAYRKIAQGNYDVQSWDPASSTLVLKPHASHSFNVELDKQPVAFRKTGGQWQQIDPASATNHALEVRLDQDMNTPPTLQAVDLKTGRRALVLEPNPQFRYLRFGKVQEIAFKGTDGTTTRGGLYLPVDYIPGRRYPLVIQTHGWDPHRFAIDGESTAGYAAQELAGHGIVVAQLPAQRAPSGTPSEGPANMAMFEGLIDELDRRGLIDPTRVGLQAWSRTGYAVRYTLSFSKYPIAAAVVVDGMEAGMMQFAIESVVDADFAGLYNNLNGGAAPYGAGLQPWLKNSPSFNLDRVHTPVLQISLGPYTFSNMWETFAGLKYLRKPVEMVWLPEANHSPLRPLERMTVQQGDVDWFCFWLKGEEDPDHSKADQYARWRQLKRLGAAP